MKITKSQLKQIIKEELHGLSESTWSRGQPTTDPEGYNVEQEWEQEQKLSTDDEWANPAEGMTDDEIYNKVDEAIRQIQSSLEDAYELAKNSPDHQNKGEGQAMANLVSSIDHWHDTYGSGEPWG